MNLRQMLVILKLRWWLVLLLFVLVVGAVAVITALTPRQYTADTSLLLDVRTDPLVATLMPAIATPAYMATQIEVIRSDRVASRVVTLLGLSQSPAAVAQWREATGSRVPLEIYFGELLLRGLQVEPARGSNILKLSYTGTDPAFAAAAVNTFARAYIDLAVELRLEPARQYSTFFDERLTKLRGDLEAAQGKLSAFQRSKGIVATDERVDLETAKLNAIVTQLANAEAELADATVRQRNAGTETSLDVQQSGAVQSLRAQLATAQTRLSEISSVVGSNHPQRIALDAQIGELRRQIAAEMRRVSGATATGQRVSSQKIGELRALADAQKRAVLGLRAERDELSVLANERETAQRAYDAVAQRRSQLSLESQADQANARVLSPAVQPLVHSKPDIPKNMVLAVLLGLAAGVAAALGWELLDRRVRGPADLVADVRVPVLGVLSPKAGPAWSAWRGPRLALPPAGQVPRLTLQGGGR